MGRAVVEALRSGKEDKLLAIIPKGMSAKVKAEVEKTHETSKESFTELLEELEDGGVALDDISYDHVVEDADPIGGVLSGAEVHFKSKGKSYYVTCTWLLHEGEPAYMGLSTWYKESESS